MPFTVQGYGKNGTTASGEDAFELKDIRVTKDTEDFTQVTRVHEDLLGLLACYRPVLEKVLDLADKSEIKKFYRKDIWAARRDTYRVGISADEAEYRLWVGGDYWLRVWSWGQIQLEPVNGTLPRRGPHFFLQVVDLGQNFAHEYAVVVVQINFFEDL